MFFMIFTIILTKNLFISCVETEHNLSKVKDWNPFDSKRGNIYSYQSINRQINPSLPPQANGTTVTTIITSPTVGISESPVSQSSNISETQIETNDTTTIETTTSVYDSFRNVPKHLQYKCKEKSSTNVGYVGGELNSGKYCVFFDVIIACISKTNRSNGYPVVQFLKDPDPRYINSNLNSGLQMGTESHIFSFFYVCTFLEEERIRCAKKSDEFPALADITPTSSFSFQSPNTSRWVLVVDNTSSIAGRANYNRHFVENGNKLVKVLTQKYEIDGAVVYVRKKYYILGYSFVGNSYYKFMFLTNSEFSEKSEVLRMLWGSNQEFIGCPKPICEASVIDTIIKLKDNTTYVFVGKYYWNLTNGVEVTKAIFIEGMSPFDTQFPYLFPDIDASFYDIQSDEAYFFKGSYVYSYVKTEVIPPIRTMPNLHGVHISKVFPGIPADINAAFYYRSNSTVYFFREYHYWAFDLTAKRALPGYPRVVTDFVNMPPNIDAILSDNLGTYYVFIGTFFAKFTEQEFKIGLKLEFIVSNVEFFQCSKKYFDDYSQYKKEMETIFPPIPAKTLLELTFNEDINPPETVVSEGGQTNTTHHSITEDSFITIFTNLIIFGPFYYQLFIEEETKETKPKTYQFFDVN